MGYFILVFFILTFHALGAQEIEQFVCDETGRFENPTDDTCRTFYLCSFTREGDLVQTQYSCPDGSYFSPTNGICSRNFTCQRTSVEYVIDTEKGDNVYYHCQDETQYKFKCTRSGRFANLLDSNCKKYHLCSLTQNGFYVETELQCPDGTLFDPNTQKCHTKYQCPCDFIDWETSKGKIFISKQQFQKEWHHFKVEGFSCTSTDYIKEFECQKAGVFADERDVTCTDYFMCSQLSNGKYVQSFFSCPHGSAFDPFAKRCSSRYECSCQIETSTIPSNPNKLTTSYTELISSPQSCFTPKKPFVCRKRGRFPNRSDVSCSTYYLCDLSRRGELKRKLYRCPRCLYFNPKLGKCTDDYICPCNAIEGSGQSTTNHTNSRSTQSLDTTTRPVTRITTDCRMPSLSRPFRCTSRGRFPDRRDTTCSSYFLCTSLKRNIFKRSSYKCSRNLKFDPSIQRCTALYECPCTNISMTTSLNMSTISLPTTKRSTISSGPTSSSHSSNDTTRETSETTSSTININITTRISAGTTEDCRGPAFEIPFRCTSIGFFPNRRDITCSTYFQCYLVRRGSFRRHFHQCRRNLKFDPSLGKCSARYVCPCETTTVNMTTPSLPTSQSSTISSEPTFSSSFLNTTTRQTTETVSSTNTRPTSTSRTTIVTTQSPIISTSSNVSTTQTPNITTSLSSGTTDDCSVPAIDRPFRCTARGRFPDRRDVTCVSYFLCATDWRGILRRTSARCQRNSRFDPTIQRCTTRYVCPCIVTSRTTQNMTTMSLPTTQRSTISSESITSTPSLSTTPRPTTETGPSINTGTTATMPTTQRSTISSEPITFTPSLSTTPRPTTETVPSINTGPTSTSRTTVTTESSSTSTSSNISTSTQISNTTTSFSTATTDDCTVPSVDRPFRCTTRGRFPDRRDVNCGSYFLCSTDRRGILRRTSVRCRRNTRFDPTIQRCTTRYVCPCIVTSRTTQNMTTMSLPTTQRSTISSEAITSTPSLSTTPRPTTETGPSINTGTTATMPTTQRSTISSKPVTSTPSLSTTPRPTTETVPSINTGTTSTSRTTVTTESSSTSTSSNISTSTQISNTTTSFSTATTDDCTVPSVDRPFRCTTRGRFPDRRDVNCGSYFSCSTDRRGILRRTSMRCRRNTRFDPTIQRCTTRYVCPCIVTSRTTTTPRPTTETGSSINTGTTATMPTTQRSTISSEPVTFTPSLSTTPRPTTETGPSINTGTTSTSRTTVTTESSSTSTSSNISTSTQISNTTTSFSTATSINCIVPSSDRPFRCTSVGVFPNRRDITCSTYFQCYLVRRGSFRRHFHQCRRNLKFDPSLGKCSARYVCPCENTTVNLTTPSLPTSQSSTISSEPTFSSSFLNTTTRQTTETVSSTNSRPTSTSRTTIVTTQSPIISTSSNVSTTQTSNTTTSLSSGTTDDCSVPAIDRPFRCTARGRFPDRRDVTCVSYFLCATDWRGILRRTSARCQRNSRFDPTIQRCTTRYVCPCIVTSRTTQNMTTMSLPTTQRSTISSESITSTPSLSTTSRPTTETGPSINTGTTATMPTTQRSTISSEPITFTPSLSTTPRPTTETVPSINTGPTSTSRTTVTTESSSTSTSSNISTSTQISNTTTSFSTATTDDCTVPSVDRPFRCTTRGRFPDRRDVNCGSYFLCSTDRRGILRRTSVRCRRNTRFDPTIQRCTTRYVCPCIVTSRTTQNMTTMSLPTTQRSTISSEAITSTPSLSTTPRPTTETGPSINTGTTATMPTTQRSTISSEPVTSTPSLSTTPRPTTETGPSINTGTTSTSRTTVTTESSSTSTSSNISTSTQISNTTTSFSTATTDDCTVPSIDRPFRCTERGRFPDRRDVTCVSYFLCATDWRGILRRTSARCQRNSRFDPTIQRCTTRYVCPCIVTSRTTQNMTTMSLPTTQRSTISSEPITSTPSPSTTPRTTTETGPSINTGTTATMPTTQRSTISSEPVTSTPSLSTTPRTTTETGPSVNTGTTSSSRTTVTTESSSTSTSSNISTSTQFSNTTTSFSTATSINCIVPSSDRPFRCTSVGVFPNRRDITCSTYFQCYLVRRGSFRRHFHQCRRNLKFDPSLGKCSARYVCPCENTTVNLTTPSLPTSQSSTISSEPTFSSSFLNTTTRQTTETVSSTNTRPSSTSRTTIVTTQSPTISTSSNVSTTQTLNTTTSLSSGTTDDCSVPAIDRPFRCTARGRFPDRRDVTCVSYFLCATDWRGILRRTSARCQRNSRFDPTIQRCTTRYVCPCIVTSRTTQNMTTMSLPTTQRSTISSEPVTSTPSLSTTPRPTTETGPSINTGTTSTSRTTVTTESSSTSTSSNISTSTQISNTTTSFSTATTDDCTVPSIDRPFRCTERGRFPDRRDVTCVSYFLCATDWRGILRRTSARCQRNSRFDPTIQRCTTRYVCPCILTSRTTQNMTTMSLPTTQRSTISSEPITSTPSPSTTPRTTTETGPSINTGTTATMPTTQRSTISSEPVTSTPSLSTTPRPTTETGPSINTGTASSSRTTVTTESSSTSTSSNISTSTQISNTTTSFSTATTDDCTVPSIDRPFRCTERGRFPDRRDVTCVSYFLCATDWRGILRRTSARCQRNSRFDPTIQRCTTRYVCPCILTSRTTQNMTTMSLPTTQRSTISSEPITSTPSPSTTPRTTTETGPSINTGTTATMPTTQRSTISSAPVTSTPSLSTTSRPTTETGPSINTGTASSSRTTVTTESSSTSTSSNISTSTQISNTTTCFSTATTDDCTVPSIDRPFRCTERGRFPDRRDVTCVSYFLCATDWRGILRRTSARCQRNSRFDPTIQRCTTRYVCPCIVTSRTTQNMTTMSLPTTQRSTISSEPITSTPSPSTTPRTTTETGPSINTGTTATMPTTQRSTISSEPVTSTPSLSTTPRPTTETGPSINTGTASSSRTTVTTESSSTSTSSNISTSTQISNTTTSFSTATSINCIVPSSDRPFRCRSVGVFPNRRDITCSTYFQCYLVRRGSFRRHFHQCRRNLKFDPSLGKCSARYVCSCETTTVNMTTPSLPTSQSSTISSEPTFSSSFLNTTTRQTTETVSSTNTRPTSTSRTTIVTTQSPIISTSSNVSTTQIPNTTTSLSSGTTDDCSVPAIDRPFRCTSRGRFPDRRDVTCVSYFTCTMDWQGILRRSSFRCQRNTRFDPSNQICTTRYVCPCIVTSRTTQNMTTMSLPTTQRSTISSEPVTSTPSLSTTPRTTTETGPSINTGTTSTSTEASTRTSHRTTLRPISETTSYTSSEIITSTRSTTKRCIFPSPDYEFNCESEGRFPDIADQRCFSYFLCSYIGGRYVQSQFRCPSGSKFDPYIGKCSFVYDCPCDSIGGTTSTSLSTAEACSITKEKFICTETGHFKNPTDLSCCTYYLCSSSQNGTIIQKEYSCPEGYKFDPDSRKCTEDYTCPCSVTEPIENFTPPSFECDIPTEEFVCTSVGRFPNRQDVSCCNYILCSISEIGSFVKFEYSCPEGTTFDPELQRCSEFYQCPCINTEVSEN